MMHSFGAASVRVHTLQHLARMHPTVLQLSLGLPQVVVSGKPFGGAWVDRAKARWKR